MHPHVLPTLHFHVVSLAFSGDQRVLLSVPVFDPSDGLSLTLHFFFLWLVGGDSDMFAQAESTVDSPASVAQFIFLSVLGPGPLAPVQFLALHCLSGGCTLGPSVLRTP